MKIIVSITDGKKTYSEDVTKEQEEYFEDISNPEFATFEQWTRELEPSLFTTPEIKKYNTRDKNSHFIYGWVESFAQSEDIPNWMLDVDYVLFISVRHEPNHSKKDEKIYIDGKTQSIKDMIIYCQNKLRSFGIELRTKDEFDQERIHTIATLRMCCSEHGDNDWDDNLHLSDIINKHLIDYFEE